MGGSFSASALMWPSLEREISTEEEMCFASKKAASGAEVHFQQRAGGIHTSWVFFTETYEGSLSGSHTHTHTQQADSADSREALLPPSLCAEPLCRGFRVASTRTLETG